MEFLGDPIVQLCFGKRSLSYYRELQVQLTMGGFLCSEVRS